ncbi:hypothetical protein BOX15_Mlig023669g3 [Macrostomum lignano]|uniref:Uncharacterized protein n=1 Tax=Macrostomum lignano TaxID=282301 RepID=A0A267E2I8_9PLAT|nr:hypothetical protein BOX15_Mlig023669g3 [Macrostomum lignano]
MELQASLCISKNNIFAQTPISHGSNSLELGFLDESRQCLILLKCHVQYSFKESFVSLVHLPTMESVVFKFTKNNHLDSGDDSSDRLSQDFIERFSEVIHGGEQELTEAAKKAKEEKFLKKRLNNRNDLVDIQFLPEKCTLNLAFSQHLKASEEIRVGVGVPPIWLGAVVRLDYSDVEKGNPTGEMQFQHSIGKVFDMGPAVAFLHDNQHLVNYKLQIVDYMKGEVMRCLSQDEDLYFVRLQATPDCSLLVGQVYFPAYEVEFAVFDDESMNSSDLFAIVPPRGLQVYVISDGRRVANYLFESDPFGLCLVGEDGRDLLVLTHNAPIMLFELHDPQPLVAADGAAQMHSMKAIDATANVDSSVGSPAKAPGPRPEYLDMLKPALASSMAEVANARPVDPIEFLAQCLLRCKAQCDSQQPDI